MRVTLPVTGTMVMTPRPWRAALALAMSLLTMTAGRALVGLGSADTIEIGQTDLTAQHAGTVECGRFPRSASPEASHSSQAAAYASSRSGSPSSRIACWMAADRDARPAVWAYLSNAATSSSDRLTLNFILE